MSNQVIFIVGPTGTGKSDLAVEAAAAKNAVIVNIDSVQMFKHVQIGAAKPTPQMMARVPHFLFDIVDKNENLTAGDYRRQALPLLREQISQHNIFVVGGSGFYVQALEHGMIEVEPVPEEVMQKLDEDMATLGNAILWQELERLDPEAAKKIHVNDSYRLKRALSLVRAHGQAAVQARSDFAAGKGGLAAEFQVQKVGLTLSRERLRDRIYRRTHAMLAAGLVDEVSGLLAQGLRDWAPLKSVGYLETVRYLDGDLTIKELPGEIVKSTMALAKRQVTWFKRDREIRWFDAEIEAALAKEYLLSL